MEESKIKKVLKFYLLATELKEKIRTGWKKWNIESERVESVAEHIYGTCILAIAMDSEFDFEINLQKVILMLVIHELEEIKIGDLNPFDHVTKEEKRRIGKLAVAEVLKDLVKKEEYIDLIEEFEEMKTKEAVFCKMCDKLEADIQSKIYEENGYINIYSTDNLPQMQDERIIGLIQNGAKTLCDLFVENDRPVFTEGKFNDVANYLEKDDHILKLKEGK